VIVHEAFPSEAVIQTPRPSGQRSPTTSNPRCEAVHTVAPHAQAFTASRERRHQRLRVRYERAALSTRPLRALWRFAAIRRIDRKSFSRCRMTRMRVVSLLGGSPVCVASRPPACPNLSWGPWRSFCVSPRSPATFLRPRLVRARLGVRLCCAGYRGPPYVPVYLRRANGPAGPGIARSRIVLDQLLSRAISRGDFAVRCRLGCAGPGEHGDRRDPILSVSTVEMHLSRAYRKLGVRSRTELANALARADAP
jgi:hypothetical protein